jgi:hypothetical protein
MAGSKISRTRVKADLRRLADVVQREVEAGATSVEEIHKSIARMPLDVIAKLDVFEKSVKDVRKIQETSIGAIYDLIRKVNGEVAKLAKEMLDGRAAAAARKRVRPAAKAKAHAVRVAPPA